MSKKEILDRLNRSPKDARRRRRPASTSRASDSKAPPAKKEETRVSGGVIRRRTTRRRKKPGHKPAEGLPSGLPVASRREPGKAEEQKPKSPKDNLPTATEVTAPPEAREPEPPAEAAPPPEPAEPEPEEAPPAAPPAEAVAEPEPEPEPVASPEQTEPESPAEEPAPPAPAEAGAEAPETAQPEPVDGVEVSAGPEVPPAGEPSLPAEEPTPPPEEPAAQAEPEAEATDPEPEPPEVESAEAAEDPLEESPVADRPHHGLGKAVVKPPPGYDPTDPLGSLRRARQEAKERTAAPAQQERWSGKGEAPSTDFRDDQRRKPRSRPRPRRQRRTGRVEMLMAEMPIEQPRKRRRRRRRGSGPKKPSPPPKAIKRRIQVDGEITVAQLAHEMSVKAPLVIRKLIEMNHPATMNESLDVETAQLVADDFDYEVVDVGFKEEEHLLTTEQDETEAAEPRPPVVTVMGHVDHGKTTLLDSIRKTRVAQGEAGGITQHMSAYQVEHEGNLVTFIDTPGHAAFTEMRARGAHATDIVILVVAADDGVMPQTVECINHTRAAEVPIVVAINKCDKPGVKPDRVRQRLMEHELVPEEYGGETQMVEISALKGEGIDDLLEAVILQAELYEYEAPVDRHAEGVVLEARLEKGRGAVCTMVVQKGTLNKGDHVVVGNTYGRVRAMSDFQGKRIKSAGPSTPVEIMGLSEVPEAGDHFEVVADDKDAKALAEHRVEEARRESLRKRKKKTLEDLLSQAQEGEIPTLTLVVKGDVQGSVEAILGALDKVEVEGTNIKILHDAVGGISESDITLANAYDGIVIGFNVRPDAKARRSAEQYGVQIRTYKVIYELLDDVRKALVGLLAPVMEEEFLGRAEVRDTFPLGKVGRVAGCFVHEGMMARNARVRLVRDGVVVWEGRLASLRRFKDDVREVQKGLECGMVLDGFHDIKIGDDIECFRRVMVAATG